jgi:hypothetical protein
MLLRRGERAASSAELDAGEVMPTRKSGLRQPAVRLRLKQRARPQKRRAGPRVQSPLPHRRRDLRRLLTTPAPTRRSCVTSRRWTLCPAIGAGALRHSERQAAIRPALLPLRTARLAQLPVVPRRVRERERSTPCRPSGSTLRTGGKRESGDWLEARVAPKAILQRCSVYSRPNGRAKLWDKPATAPFVVS